MLQRRPRWRCLTQQWAVTLLRSTFRWEFSTFVVRAVALPAGTQVKGLLQASVLSVHSLLCAIKHRYTEAHLSISALCSSMEIQYLRFFRSVCWRYLASINYYIPRLKNYSVAQNAVSISMSWRQGARLNELHLPSETWEAQLAHSVSRLVVSGWLG